MLKFSIQLLDAYSPLKSLARGYCLTLNDENKLITSLEQVAVHEKITIQYSDGKIKAEILNKEKNNE